MKLKHLWTKETFYKWKKNRLKPNIRYKTGEYDYFYETDNLGRIEKFETDKLQLTEREKRLSHSKNTLGKVKGKMQDIWLVIDLEDHLRLTI